MQAAAAPRPAGAASWTCSGAHEWPIQKKNGPHRALFSRPGDNPSPLIGLCKFLLHTETFMEGCVFETTLEGCKKKKGTVTIG